MATPVLLNNVDHASLRVATGHGAAWGDAVNQAVVLPSELEELQREYAVLLRRNDAGAFRFVALTGLDAGENLFLDDDRWDARYVPALHRRGPFSIGRDPAGEPVIHVDLGDPRVREDGEPVFLDQGGAAPALDRAAAALRTLAAGAEMGGPMIDAWAALDLIAPVTLELDLGDGRRWDLPDCHTVDARSLAALRGAALERLHAADLLRPAIWVASSLGNVRALLNRKLARP